MAVKALIILAITLVLGAVLTGCTGAYRDRLAEKNYPPVGKFVHIKGRKVHYVQAGQGPDVILLHGAGGNLRDFTFDLMDRLTDRYRVTAFDRPGLGYTDRVPGVATGAFATEGDSPNAQAAMLREAAEQIGISNPIVVGHSFGGIVAMAWATTDLDAPSDSNAAAVVSYGGISMPWPGKLGAYYTLNGTALGGALVIPVITALVPMSVVRDGINNVFTPQDAPDGYADHIGAPLTLRTDSFRANIRQVNTLRPKVVDMTALYTRLTLPIEILHGTADQTVPITVHPEELVKIVPTARLTSLDGIGHMPQHAAPEEAVAAIDRAAARAGLR